MSGRMGSKKRRVFVDRLIERDGLRCTWCCREMKDAPINPGVDCSLHVTLEHLVPRVQGGRDEWSNFALSCYQCNNARAGEAVDFIAPWVVVA